MKRYLLAAIAALALAGAYVAASPSAQAKNTATPSPSPSPSALPTASPEPPDVAIPRLEARLKANPNDQEALGELASQFLAINRPDLALALTQHLLQLGARTYQTYALDGYAQQQLGNTNAAIGDFEQASTLDPTNLSVLSQLAELYLRTNRPQDAERVAKRAVTFNKTEPRAYIALGAVYAAEQHYDDARAQYELAYQQDPKSTDALFQIATTYAVQNNIPMALTTIQRALAIDPKSVDALVFKADLYAKQNDDAKTSAAYDDAVVAASSDDQKVAILMRKAGYFVDQKKYSQADAIFQQTIAQYPRSAAALVAYGDFQALQRNLGKAETEWQAALAIDKDNPQALARMGQLSMQQSRYTDAIGYLKHLTQVAPDAQAFALLGQAYSYVHDYQSSRDACSKSFQIQRSPGTLGCIGGADYELKNYKEAAAIFDVIDRAAKGSLDSNPQLLYIAAKSYEHNNQRSKALAAYKRLLPLTQKGSKDYNQIQAEISSLSKGS